MPEKGPKCCRSPCRLYYLAPPSRGLDTSNEKRAKGHHFANHAQTFTADLMHCTPHTSSFPYQPSLSQNPLSPKALQSGGKQLAHLTPFCYQRSVLRRFGVCTTPIFGIGPQLNHCLPSSFARPCRTSLTTLAKTSTLTS
eukprot:scaffold385_cov305-Pinguiococcus_pyrenoidosus.AAC.16